MYLEITYATPEQEAHITGYVQLPIVCFLLWTNSSILRFDYHHIKVTSGL